MFVYANGKWTLYEIKKALKFWKLVNLFEYEITLIKVIYKKY